MTVEAEAMLWLLMAHLETVLKEKHHRDLGAIRMGIRKYGDLCVLESQGKEGTF
jgi:hypothetical protein